MRFVAFLLILVGTLLSARSVADELRRATLYKDPSCGCCAEYAEYLRRNGFEVTVVDTADLSSVKQFHGVPAPLEGCHTTVVGGYVVEGHVPVAAVNRLLAEKPPILGISLPGMPEGSPGMGGRKKAPFTIFAITEGGGPAPTVYATE
jgi:hypothetical protein